MLEKGGLNCEQEEFVAQSLRKAIDDCEQADEQEPLAWTQRNHVVGLSISLKKTVYHTVPLYTHPSSVRRLTAREITCMAEKLAGNRTSYIMTQDTLPIFTKK